ncbi:hypothetical protein EV175_004552 [Coemansia sp. RSA 1933]|nr:hypothetical protein EV175_004552 [Coemansia sp. RSA 1933]
MRNIEDAQKARNDLTETLIHDRKVRVDFSFTSRAHPATPGKYKGQDTGSSGEYQHMNRGGGDRYYGGIQRNRGPQHQQHGRPYRDHGIASASYRMRRRANTRDRRRTDSYNNHHQPLPPHRGSGRQWGGGGRSKSPSYNNHGPSRGGYDSYRGPSSSYHEDGRRGPSPPPPPPPLPPAREYDDRRNRSSRSPGGRYGYSSRNAQTSGGGGVRHGGYQNRYYGQDHHRESVPHNGNSNGHHY